MFDQKERCLHLHNNRILNKEHHKMSEKKKKLEPKRGKEGKPGPCVYFCRETFSDFAVQLSDKYVVAFAEQLLKVDLDRYGRVRSWCEGCLGFQVFSPSFKQFLDYLSASFRLDGYGWGLICFWSIVVFWGVGFLNLRTGVFR